MTELEQKAEEYTKYIFENQKYTSYSCFDCKRLHEHNEQFGIGEQEVLRLLKQAYKDGYEQGQEEIGYLKECLEENRALKDTVIELEKSVTEKNSEVEELKAENKALAEENNILVKGLGCETCSIHLEHENLNNQIEELKAQIEKMKQIMTNVFDVMIADMCSTENEVLFDYLKRFLEKYEVIV